MSPHWLTIDRLSLLHIAAREFTETCTKMVKFLLEKGTNPHLRSFGPGPEYTPLEYMLRFQQMIFGIQSSLEDEMVILKERETSHRQDGPRRRGPGACFLHGLASASFFEPGLPSKQLVCRAFDSENHHEKSIGKLRPRISRESCTVAGRLQLEIVNRSQFAIRFKSVKCVCVCVCVVEVCMCVGDVFCNF